MQSEGVFIHCSLRSNRNRLGNLFSKLETQAHCRIDRGSLQEAACETVRHLSPHDARISVEALREFVIGEERNRVQLSTALGQAGIRAMSRIQGSGCPALKTVLVFVIISDGQFEVGSNRISCARPKYLEDPVGPEGSVIGAGKRVTTQEGLARKQRVTRVGELDMLIAAEKLHRSEGILGEK